MTQAMSKMMVRWLMKIELGGANDEDGGGAGREGDDAVFADPERSGGVDVNIAAMVGPVCNNALKEAITDGGKSGLDGP